MLLPFLHVATTQHPFVLHFDVHATIVVPVRPPPPARDPCAFPCQSGRPFVCGSDGVVYESRCHLSSVNCYRNMRITVRNEGFCVSESSPTTPAPAIKVTTPVATTSQATTPGMNTA